MTPKISVLIPVYNMERFLSQSLSSVVAQTLLDIEIICVNDGSCDASLTILQEWQAKDARIKIIDKQNEGVGKARNDALSAATGEFISFMDPDDLYPASDTLEILYQCAISQNVKVVGGKILKVDENGIATIEEDTRESFGLSFSEIGKLRYADWQYDYGYTAFLFERKMLLEHNIYFPLLSRFQDPPFFVKALATADEFYRLDIPTYAYRLWGQMRNSKPSKTADMIEGLVLNLQLSREKGLAKLYYLTAMRLQKEVSYILINQLELSGIAPILLRYFNIYDGLDFSWLVEQGYDVQNIAIPECLSHLLAVNCKYTNLRRNPILRLLAKLTRRGV